MIRFLSTLMILITLYSGMATAMPEWAGSNATKRDGEKLSTVCSGSGPSIDIARGEAIRGCKASASDFLSHTGSVHSLLTESGSDVDFHQSVEEKITYKGLTCNPEREQIEPLETGSVRLWLLCSFDLSKASVGEDNEHVNTLQGNDPNANKHLIALRSTKVKPAAEFISKEKIVLNIASVPSCSRLILKGGRPRTVSCSSHPAAVVIFPEDDIIIIEAKGYAPKSLDLRSKHWKNHDSVQVILDAH